MGGLLAAYLTTLGIVTYRWTSGPGQAPPPIAIAAAGGLFAGAALAGRADERLGNALGWAMVLAAYFAPRSNLKAVREAFGPAQAIEGTGGPKYHHTGDKYTPRAHKGVWYYKLDPASHKYVIVDSHGKRVPATPSFDRPPIGFQSYPGTAPVHV